ncbi:hypothetical protein GJ699_11900 [Duganella sp. FT80W]|uniref:Uncharacterized protein n=1 Tax=Duganella guangzhouensis TaxID=2666084 RepID=A0A6I2KY67_9BURK|nr:hypothetical protein [Duganella guangzhouensis]MRW90693.1 hypothetical protein [Duganella guangzhouensis]
MIEKDCAIELQRHALAAIRELSMLLNKCQGNCSADRFEQLRDGVGRSIGQIQMGILEVVIEEFPELDDLQ